MKQHNDSNDEPALNVKQTTHIYNWEGFSKLFDEGAIMILFRSEATFNLAQKIFIAFDCANNTENLRFLLISILQSRTEYIKDPSLFMSAQSMIEDILYANLATLVAHWNAYCESQLKALQTAHDIINE